MYDFNDSTDTLKFWTEKPAIIKTFLFFIQFWWNLVKLYYKFIKFHQNRMKNKKVLIIDCLTEVSYPLLRTRTDLLGLSIDLSLLCFEQIPKRLFDRTLILSKQA